MILCPAADGLTAARMDLALLLPRMNHNLRVIDSARQSAWAAILISDPFGSDALLFSQLESCGYQGIINWPSAILLEGQMQQAMATIPATPEHEYAFLAKAATAGLKTMAFVRTVVQARQALAQNLDALILHPGILEPDNDFQRLLQTLRQRIETIRTESPEVKILAYTSDWHEQYIALRQLPVDGLVEFVSNT